MDKIKTGARLELARRHFYDYCKLKYPRHYTDKRGYLKDVCNQIEEFVGQNDDRFLVITLPPRHYKSFTGTALVEWLFGRDNKMKVMTGSYNETLSTSFARKVRDTIEEVKSGDRLVFGDIFAGTKVKYGQASASKWALVGSSQENYLATSPSGTATGFGANIILIDDIIKNSEEAYNEAVKDKQWSWLTNTMMQRTEGDDWKIIIIMTRWATDDLAGRVLSNFENVRHISYSAVQEDGSMLCDDVLNRTDYELKTRNMNPDIVEANFNQNPVDITGRLYETFKEYKVAPSGVVRNYTDTADKGTDYLCSINYIEFEDEAYVTDLVFSNKDMETTEPLVANLLHSGGVNRAVFESNNGGVGYSRNIERILKDEYKSNSTVIEAVPQTSNKEARILSSSAWVSKHVYMPIGWAIKYPEFHKHVTSYQSKGKNKHDDGPDVLAAIYESITTPESRYSAWTI